MAEVPDSDPAFGLIQGPMESLPRGPEKTRLWSGGLTFAKAHMSFSFSKEGGVFSEESW